MAEYIEHGTVLDIVPWKPGVLIGPISIPTNKVPPAPTTMSMIEDLVNCKFLCTVRSHDRSRADMLASREPFIIIGVAQLQQRGMECQEDMHVGGQVEGVN